MNKLAVFRQEASVGAHVTLRLTRGEDVSGRIAQLDDAYVRLDLDGGKTVTFFPDLLAGWEVHARAESLPAPETHDRKDSAHEPGSDGPASTHDVRAADVASALARIKAKFSEAVKRARLAPPEPDFQFPDDGFPAHEIDAIRREWDRAQNQYLYALKMKEPHRLNNIVQTLMPLAQTYPDSPATRSLLGRVLLKLDRWSEAMDHLSAAAALSEAPDHWLALASAAADDTATECYALRKYFGTTAPTDAKEAWFRYLAVANPIDLTGAGRVIDRWSSAGLGKEDDTDHLLSESLVHLLLSSGSPSLAQQAAANLVHDSGRLPAGWQDALDHATAPSDELRAAERRLARPSTPTGSAAHAAQPDRPHGTDTANAVAPPTPDQIHALQQRFRHGGEGVRHGRIKSFGNQRFGFIQIDAGDTVFFRLQDVTDDGLRDELLDGQWRLSGEVEFNVYPSPGHKYGHATSIVKTSVDSLLRRARAHLETGQLNQAMGCVNRALQADPTDNTALLLQAEIKPGIQKQLRRGTGLPRGNGPYERAKRAQLVHQDLDKAEQLLRQAILTQPDKKKSAIKDLASLLQQQGRAEEAIFLLTEHAAHFKHDTPYDNMLATLYQHAHRYDDAIALLTKLLNSAPTARKIPLLKNLAYCHFRSARYDDAERTLQNLLDIDSNDRTAARWLAGIEDARNSKSHDEAKEIIESLGELGEEGLELSPLAQAAIEQCTYEGVKAEKLQAGATDANDVRHLEGLIKDLGTKRPRDRAGYCLSAAALLNRDTGSGQHGRVYKYLSRYFASMAKAASIEKKPAEVVRSYYIESLGLVSENDKLDSENDKLDEAWRSLFGYITTFSLESIDFRIFPQAPRGKPIPRQRYTDAIQRAIEMMVPQAQTGWQEGLLALGSQSSFAKTAIGNAVQASTSLAEAFEGSPDGAGQQINVQERWPTHCQEYRRRHRKRLTACRTMTNYQATAAAMEDLRDQLTGFSDTSSSEVDRRRLFFLIDIVESARAFCSASDFEEKERNYWLVVNQVDGFRKDVVDTPTQYSHDGLLPIADHLKSLIEEEYAVAAQTSGAELSLQLLVGEYTRGQNGELRIQIGVSNKPGCSPASSVRIGLRTEKSEYFVADRQESETVPTLRGGASEVIQMIVRPLDAALKDRAFPVNAMAEYQNSLGETVHTPEHSWTVRLYPDKLFQHLDNPYTPFAEGGPVDAPNMFVGREEVLDRLERSLLAESANKSIVMFGQKRAGKSSLIEHLRRRLARRETVVAVPFSLQDIASDLSVTAFLHRILQSASDALEELRFDGRDVPDFSPPSIEEMESHPTLRFHNAMTPLVRAMKRRSAPLDFVFLVDEFTDIFKEIRRDRIPPQFMKAWKSIIEKKYFASVLVGQDVMPAFKAEFPNEFGVTEDMRVTYLDDAAAATLIEKPIGRKRFAGQAVRCLLELTAGSPYYTMMFCARLVDFMNATRAMIVTEADIRTVEQEMLQGERRLTKDKFDNLLSAGDGKEDSGIDPEDTYAVCSAIACGSGKETWCSRHVIREFGGADLDRLLEDLETRDVVERKEDAYRLRVGLFKDWLLARRG